MVADIFNQPQKASYGPDNECKREYIDKLNVITATKPFWKTCKHGGSKITLIENDRIVFENNKIAKTFNTYFEVVTDSLNLFQWIGESVNSRAYFNHLLHAVPARSALFEKRNVFFSTKNSKNTCRLGGCSILNALIRENER